MVLVPCRARGSEAEVSVEWRDRAPRIDRVLRVEPGGQVGDQRAAGLAETVVQLALVSLEFLGAPRWEFVEQRESTVEARKGHLGALPGCEPCTKQLDPRTA